MEKMFSTLRKERQNKSNDSGSAYVINKIIHIVGLTRTKPTVVYLMQWRPCVKNIMFYYNEYKTISRRKSEPDEKITAYITYKITNISVYFT